MDDTPDRGGAAPTTGDGEPAVLPVDLRDWVVFDVDAAQHVVVLATDQLQHGLWCLEPMQATSVLRLDTADVTYTVLGGRAWFVTDQGEAGLDPLGSLLVPAGVAHGIDNRGADPLTVLAVQAPPAVGVVVDEPLDRLAAAVRPADTTGGVGDRLRAFLRGER